jgi:pyruvate dehydrogenase E1 component alpha subunit
VGEAGRIDEGIPAVEPIQLVRPDGTRVEHERYSVEWSDQRYDDVYVSMVVTRELDQEFINLQRQGQLALYPSCRGQEAAQVGAAYAVEVGDWFFPQYRELGAWVVRDIDPVGVSFMWRGMGHGGKGLIEGGSAPMSIPIGTHALHAVGWAMGSSFDGGSSVAISCTGDGATSEGDVLEAMNFAAVFDAPCIFFIQNNQWAISVPLSEQTRARTIAHKAVAFGMPGIRCDGNDVLAVTAVMKEAADRARAGGGPTLVEAVTYRMEAHTTSDDPTRYRPAGDLEYWAQFDPITRYRAFLEQSGRFSDQLDARARDAAAAATKRLRDGTYDVPDPDPLEVFDTVFVVPTRDLLEQREQLRRELAGGGA